MTTALHKQIVQELAKGKELEFSGFSKALQAATKGTEIGEVYIERHKFFPSAFRIDVEERTIWVYEVELTGPLTEYKLANLAEMWFCCDSWEWDFKLFVATSSKTLGGQFTLHEVNLCDKWYERMYEAAQEYRDGLLAREGVGVH